VKTRIRSLPGLEENQKEDSEREPLYRIIIHNDDTTPMDFVIHILITIFLLPRINAANIMYSAHLNGSAYVQTAPRAVAQLRINKAHFAAILKSAPLHFSMEPET
jgi:ATP-dependent Clp protease adaptor protein ClpS